MRRLIERGALAALRFLEPERAHACAIAGLRAGLAPVAASGPVSGPRLSTTVGGLSLPNPVGIAAGFDKNAEALAPLLSVGAGFVEIGAVTPRSQPGNPRPRLFRLPEDAAAINRFGFNNDGMEAIRPRLATVMRSEWASTPGRARVGVNLGANKDSADKAADYAEVLAHLHDLADFFTINVSSPNTAGLRALQGRHALETLLARVFDRRAALGSSVPVLLKIAPELGGEDLADVAAVARDLPLAGIVATNTTTARDGLRGRHAAEAGGLSGRPLFARSTEVLRNLYRLTEGTVPLVGVGGVASAEDALEKITAGASAVQLYTAMVYDGVSLPARIARRLDELLEERGFETVPSAVGRSAA